MLYADLFLNKELFIKLVYKMKEYDYYFLLKKDCTRMYSFKKKSTISHPLRLVELLAYGARAGMADVHLCMS
jgi:hypothetical protein